MRRSIFFCIATIALLYVAAVPAYAHEHREVGRYEFVVGWGDEPAFAGFKNAVSLTLAEHPSGRAVADVGDALKVEVTFGSHKTTLNLSPAFRVGVFGTPGEYSASLVPTRPGAYEFRVFGTIRGAKVNETFKCGETTFDCIEDVAEIQFPERDPSTGQLAARINREIPRTETRIAAVKDDAGSARLFGIIGIVLGVLALVAAFLLGRKSSVSA